MERPNHLDACRISPHRIVWINFRGIDTTEHRPIRNPAADLPKDMLAPRKEAKRHVDNLVLVRLEFRTGQDSIRLLEPPDGPVQMWNSTAT